MPSGTCPICSHVTYYSSQCEDEFLEIYGSHEAELMCSNCKEDQREIELERLRSEVEEKAQEERGIV